MHAVDGHDSESERLECLADNLSESWLVVDVKYGHPLSLVSSRLAERTVHTVV